MRAKRPPRQTCLTTVSCRKIELEMTMKTARAKTMRALYVILAATLFMGAGDAVAVRAVIIKAGTGQQLVVDVKWLATTKL